MHGRPFASVLVDADRPVDVLGAEERLVAVVGAGVDRLVVGLRVRVPLARRRPCAQWIAIPTKSVCARLNAADPKVASCESRPSFHSGDPWPKTRVMSPVGSTPYTRAPVACAIVSGAVSVTPVPVAPAVPTLAIGRGLRRRAGVDRQDLAGRHRCDRADLDRGVADERRGRQRCDRDRGVVLELDVRCRDAADVAAGCRVGEPRLGRRLAAVADHVRQRIGRRGGDVRPVLERGRERRDAVRRVVAVASSRRPGRCGPGRARSATTGSRPRCARSGSCGRSRGACRSPLRKLRRCGICSRSDGTPATSRLKCVLSNCR